MKFIFDLKKNERPSLCSRCGGKCCKTMPGIVTPSELGMTPREIGRELRRRLDSGKWALDWWEKDSDLPQTYYLRPAIKGCEGQQRHGSWGGECALLGPSGCTLSWNERPWGCRDLKPHRLLHPHCTSVTGHGKLAEVRLWLPYQNIIKRITGGSDAPEADEQSPFAQLFALAGMLP